MNTTQNSSENNTIEVKYVLKYVLSKIGIVVITALTFAICSIILFAFIIRPDYSSTAKFMIDAGSSTASAGIDAAKKLSATYIDLLHSDETYEKVIKQSGTSYKANELSEIITADLVEGTAILAITVTTKDANEAANIANSVSTVLSERAESYVKGSSIELVQSAQPNYNSTSRSIVELALIALALGAFLSVAVLGVLAVLNNTVHDEKYMLEHCKYPMLAQIPSMTGNSLGGFGKSNKGKLSQ